MEHRGLCSRSCGSLDGRGVWGRIDTRICMAESLCCPLTLCSHLNYSPPGSTIFQARILEWVAISFSRGSSQPRDRTQVSSIPGRCFHGLQLSRLLCPWNSPSKNTGVGCHSLLQRIFLTQGSNPGLLHYSNIK